MALSITSTGSGTSSGSTTVTCTFGSAPAEDDIILIGVMQNPDGSGSFGDASITGFSALSSNGVIDNGAWARMSVLKKIAGASEGTGYTVTITGGNTPDALVTVGIAFAGGNPTTPDPTVSQLEDTGSNTTALIPAITTAEDASYDVAFVCGGGNNSQGAGSWLSSWGDSLVEQEDVPSGWASIGLGAVIRATAGVQAQTSVTIGAGDTSLAIRIEVAEAEGGATPLNLLTLLGVG